MRTMSFILSFEISHCVTVTSLERLYSKLEFIWKLWKWGRLNLSSTRGLTLAGTETG